MRSVKARSVKAFVVAALLAVSALFVTPSPAKAQGFFFADCNGIWETAVWTYGYAIDFELYGAYGGARLYGVYINDLAGSGWQFWGTCVG